MNDKIMARQNKPVRVGSNAMALLAIVWTLFSLFGVFDWFSARRTWNDPNAIPDYVIWGLHLLFIVLAIYGFRTEKPREICIETDGDNTTFDDLVMPQPQEIDFKTLLEKETSALKAALIPFGTFSVFALFLSQFNGGNIHSLKGMIFFLFVIAIGYFISLALKFSVAYRQHRAFLKLPKNAPQNDAFSNTTHSSRH